MSSGDFAAGSRTLVESKACLEGDRLLSGPSHFVNWAGNEQGGQSSGGLSRLIVVTKEERLLSAAASWYGLYSSSQLKISSEEAVIFPYNRFIPLMRRSQGHVQSCCQVDLLHRIANACQWVLVQRSDQTLTV
jgi:hypothetical protein